MQTTIGLKDFGRDFDVTRVTIDQFRRNFLDDRVAYVDMDGLQQVRKPHAEFQTRGNQVDPAWRNDMASSSPAEPIDAGGAVPVKNDQLILRRVEYSLERRFPLN
ncbi:hypothetical protein [Mesorhizobium sp. 1B3]|uniref:hypothetical protein n=1 Tax=Mesorhizobium sp. 1B3 TaxID=3243599 RepID=UPI003D9637F9